MVNNLRDQVEDRKVGKNTLAVIFGTFFVRVEYSLCLLFSGIISCYLASKGHPWAFLSLLALLLSFPALRSVWREEGSALDHNLGKTARVLILFSLLFSVGWCL